MSAPAAPAAAVAAPPAAIAQPMAPAMPQGEAVLRIEEAQAIAKAINPADIAQFVEAPQPPSVEIFQRFFGSVDGVVVGITVLVIAFLLARLIQSWMLHRSINKSIEAKSAHVNLLIDKVNKPMELAVRGPREVPGDDRNGLVLIAIGLAMAGFGLVQGDSETIRLSVGAAFFPLFVGIALLVRRALLNRAIAREQAAAEG